MRNLADADDHVSNTLSTVASSNPWALVGAGLIGLVVSVLALGLYNYFLHPIAHVQGPFWAAVSPFWLVKAVSKARFNNDIEALHRKYGPVVRIGPNEISFASEDALKAIHNDKFTVFTKKGTSEELIFKLVFSAPNLLTVQDPEEHRKIRQALQPAFTSKALLEQQEITQRHVGLLVDRLLEASANSRQPVSLTDHLNQMVWGVVGDLCFGEPGTLDQLEQHEHMKDTHIKVAALLEFFQYLTDLPVFGTLSRVSVVMARKIAGPAKNVLRKDELRQKIMRQSGRKDFLTAILGAKESAGLSGEEIHSNMKLLLMGGFDSTAVTISALFYYLLRNPQYYRDIQADMRRNYPSPDAIDCNSLSRQPLLSAMINETMRLVPAINGHGSHRKAATDTFLEGVRIPKGTLLSADVYTLQRDPSCWAFPSEFRPERWLDGSNGPGTPFANDNQGAWRPFLVGPRVCLGREMALQSLRLTVAKIVYLFDLAEVDHAFDWDRDAGSHFVWHNYDIQAQVTRSF